jgi:hypothetical protein
VRVSEPAGQKAVAAHGEPHPRGAQQEGEQHADDAGDRCDRDYVGPQGNPAFLNAVATGAGLLSDS